MKKYAIAAVLAMAAAFPMIAPATAQAEDEFVMVTKPPEGVSGMPITMFDYIKVVIDRVDGDRVLMISANTVASRDGVNRLAAGEHITGTITSRPTRPGDTRVAVCIDTIRAAGAATVVSTMPNSYPQDGCIGQLADAAGVAGLLVKYLKPGARGILSLNGDLYVTGSIDTEPSR
jgi:hypothetical protein